MLKWWGLLLPFVLCSCSGKKSTHKLLQEMLEVSSLKPDTNTIFISAALSGKKQVKGNELLLRLDTTFSQLAAASSQVQYRVIHTDLDFDQSKEDLVYFFDTLETHFHLMLVVKQVKGKFISKGSAMVGMETFWDNAMPVIDSLTQTIWMKTFVPGTCIGGYVYEVYQLVNDTLKQVNTFPGKLGLGTCGNNKAAGRPEEYWEVECRYTGDPVINRFSQWVDLTYGESEEQGGKMIHHDRLVKKKLRVDYLGSFHKGFTCVNVYGDTIERPDTAKDFYDLYQKGWIGEHTSVCATEEKMKELDGADIGQILRNRLKIKKHVVETSQEYYGMDTVTQTYAKNYRNRVVKVDGHVIDIAAAYKKKTSHDLYEACHLSECIELYEYVNRAEVHIPLFVSGCCCGSCIEYQVLKVQLFSGGSIKVDFFENPFYEYWYR